MLETCDQIQLLQWLWAETSATRVRSVRASSARISPATWLATWLPYEFPWSWWSKTTAVLTRLVRALPGDVHEADRTGVTVVTQTQQGLSQSKGRQRLRPLSAAKSRTKAAPLTGHRLKGDARTMFKGAYRRCLVAKVLIGLSAKRRSQQPLHSPTAASKLRRVCSPNFRRIHIFPLRVLSLRVSPASCPTKGFVKEISWMRGSLRRSLAT